MNVDEYLDFANQLIRTNIRPGNGCITAARLGALMRRSRPDVDWTQFGFNSMKAFLLALEGKGLARVGDNEKGALSVWPKLEQLPIEPIAEPTKSFSPLRKPFWIAFVLDQPPGRRFFHRPSRLIRLGEREQPSPIEQWVEIRPIADADQIQWARDFIQKKNLQFYEDLNEVLQTSRWYRRLPELLATIDRPLAREWNQVRSTRVSEVVQEWCITNAVSPEVAFNAPGEPRERNFKAAPIRAPECSVKSTDDVRAKILAALACLPTEYLLEIPIPAKLLMERQPKTGALGADL